ncbi:DUF1003 domain-containing protein [Ramlibacter humi]|uniref:DUF1003 domain-containing protein n=1 Tax=Ramlibacter humi TaxID=2530451 RepID=A0A4Z0C7Q0_9BURK|nr:DUF1003 domain-containing protein [Ramlibacter humi]TFZ07696.1 DUF1003 domain-containing protein [Ramlibacter humi]
MDAAPSADRGGYRTPDSVADVTRENVAAVRRLEQLAQAKRTFADRVADIVARFCGHITFVWIHIALFTVWIAWNSIPGLHHFDPYPFTFLILCVSLEAIFLSSFILIAQNYEMRVAERRNQLDLQINLLAEQENTKILQLLERIACKVGVIEEADDEIAALEQATRPETLARQIDRSYAEANRRRAKAGDDGKSKSAA